MWIYPYTDGYDVRYHYLYFIVSLFLFIKSALYKRLKLNNNCIVYIKNRKINTIVTRLTTYLVNLRTEKILSAIVSTLSSPI